MEHLYCCVTPVETVDILEDAFEEGKLYAIGGSLRLRQDDHADHG